MKANAPFALTAATLAAMLALAACSPTTAPVPAPPVLKSVPPKQITPPPLRPAVPSPPVDWRDALRTPGTWAWSRQGALSVADYSDWFRLSCDPATRRVALAVRLRAEAQVPVPMVITATSSRRVLSAEPAGRAVLASLPANDPLLDAMAFSRGRFMVEVPGTEPLYLPSWTEVSRVIEDCR